MERNDYTITLEVKYFDGGPGNARRIAAILTEAAKKVEEDWLVSVDGDRAIVTISPGLPPEPVELPQESVLYDSDAGDD